MLRGLLTPAEAGWALETLLGLPIERYGHTAILPRAFELRDNATIYDARYLALAEALDATFLTRDAALARVPGVTAAVEVIA